MISWIKNFFMGRVRKTPPLSEEIMALFERADRRPPEFEAKSPQERVRRAQEIKNMVVSPGWIYVDDTVTRIQLAIWGRMGSEKDTHELKRLQGELYGLGAIRRAVSLIVQDGELARDEIMGKEKEQQEAKRPAPRWSDEPSRDDVEDHDA